MSARAMLTAIHLTFERRAPVGALRRFLSE